MSELNAFDITVAEEGYCEGYVKYRRAVYDKSEADKYIKLLKDKANYNEYAYKLKSEELADTCRFYEDELRRQKHKRCKAMATYFGLVSALVHGKTQLEYMRRELKWLKLAEKFKEAK